MANTKKITKTMRNEDIIAMLKGEDVKYGTTIEEAIKHLLHENELLARKNNSDHKKPTKVQVENAEIKVKVLDFLSTVEDGATSTDVMAACGLRSTQKATSILNKLKDENAVDKEIRKGRTFFILHAEG